MSAITIRNLPEETHLALKLRAAQNGRSTEAEVREILQSAVRPGEETGLGTLLLNAAAKARDALRDDDEDLFIAFLERERTAHKPGRVRRMILLDTNVLSNPVTKRPDAKVTAWLNGPSSARHFISSVSLAEMRFGAALLADGARKRELVNYIEHSLVPLFKERILSFDEAASQSYAAIMARAAPPGEKHKLAGQLYRGNCPRKRYGCCLPRRISIRRRWPDGHQSMGVNRPPPRKFPLPH